MPNLTAEQVKSILDYNQETGVFTWKVNRGGKKIGDVAGCLDRGTRILIGLNARIYLAHRLAWLYVHGEWPEHEIDHINNDPTDNRICNLRDSLRAENQCNVRLLDRNTSGIKGVSWDRINNKWVARIGHEGRYLNVGRFESIEDAEAAIRSARERLHGEFANHG